MRTCKKTYAPLYYTMSYSFEVLVIAMMLVVMASEDILLFLEDLLL